MPQNQSVSRIVLLLLGILAFVLLLVMMFLAKFTFSLRLYLIILFILWTTYLSFPILTAVTNPIPNTNAAATTPINPFHVGLLFTAFICTFVISTIVQLTYLDSSSSDDAASPLLPPEPRRPIVHMSTELKKRNVQVYYIETLGFFALFSFLLVVFKQSTPSPTNHALSLVLCIFIYVFIFIYSMPFFYSINDIFTGNFADHFGSESILFLQMLFNRHKQSELFQKYAYYSISTNC